MLGFGVWGGGGQLYPRTEKFRDERCTGGVAEAKLPRFRAQGLELRVSVLSFWLV